MSEIQPIHPFKINKNVRKYVYLLRRRQAWLTARVIVHNRKSESTFDEVERNAIEWALSELEKVNPEIKKIEYQGELNHRVDS